MWWPWKLGQGHQNLIKSFNYPIDTIHYVWPNQLLGSRDRVQKISFFLVKIWHSKCWYDLENEVNVTKIYSLLSPFPLMCLCQFGQIHLLVEKKECRQKATRTPTPTNLTFKVFVWPLKWGQGHQNLSPFFSVPIMYLCARLVKSTHWFRR